MGNIVVECVFPWGIDKTFRNLGKKQGPRIIYFMILFNFMSMNLPNTAVQLQKIYFDESRSKRGAFISCCKDLVKLYQALRNTAYKIAYTKTSFKLCCITVTTVKLLLYDIKQIYNSLVHFWLYEVSQKRCTDFQQKRSRKCSNHGFLQLYWQKQILKTNFVKNLSKQKASKFNLNSTELKMKLLEK